MMGMSIDAFLAGKRDAGFRPRANLLTPCRS